METWKSIDEQLYEINVHGDRSYARLANPKLYNTHLHLLLLVTIRLSPGLEISKSFKNE